MALRKGTEKKKKIIGAGVDSKEHLKDIPKVLSVPTEDKKGKSPRADFIKLDEVDKFGTHGFKKEMRISNKATIFDKTLKDVDARIPVKIISFMSFEYDVNKDIKKKLMKKYGMVKNVRVESGKLYAVVNDIVKSNDLPLGVLGNSSRTMDEYVNVDNIPKEIRHLTFGKGVDPIRLKSGEVYVELNAKAVIVEFILKNMEDAEMDLTKISEMTNIRYSKTKLYFALTFAEEHEGSIFISSKHVIAANLSMSHGTYEELADDALQGIRPGAATTFVRTSSIINKKTRDLVFARSNQSMVRNPIIELTEISDKDAKAIEDKNGKPLYIFNQSEAPSFLSMMGQTTRKSVNDDTVKKLYGELYDDEPVYYRDGSGKVFLCPSIKKFALFTLFESVRVPFKAGVVSSVDDIAIALEAIK